MLWAMQTQETGTIEIPVLSFVGRSGSGKTTLLVKLIPELQRRDYRIAVVKHHPHPGVELDVAGKDTWRLARAGAKHVALVTPDQVMHRRLFEREPSLEEIIAQIQEVDLILTEGFKGASTPKIEVHRGEAPAARISRGGELVALVSDRPVEMEVPRFALADIVELADWIEARYLTKRPAPQPGC